jgi:DNA-binding GntR family transcriptional regulator
MDTLSTGPTLISQAYDAILSAICEGGLQPGERLNQDQLAARLRISRQPVGQALSILKAQGFVRDTGRRGLIVAPLEREFFSAIYQLREALDPMAVRLAAERSAPADIAEARRLVSEGRKAVEAGSIDALVAADMQFHLWTYRLSGNPLVVDTMNLYWNHLRRGMSEVLRDGPRRAGIWNDHEEILHAIAGGDAAAAAKHALRHVRSAAERNLGPIPLHGGAREEPQQAARRRLAAPRGR